MRILAGIGASCLVALVWVWWRVTRHLDDHRDAISQRWRDEHSRERRE